MPGNYCFIQPKICFTGRPILDAVKSVFNGKKRDRLLSWDEDAACSSEGKGFKDGV